MNQFKFVATLGVGGMGGSATDIGVRGSNPGGMGGQSGTLSTRSRQVCRSFGDIFDQFSAFLRNSTRSVSVKLANLA